MFFTRDERGGLAYNEKVFKKGWRRLCAEGGLNPATGRGVAEETTIDSVYQRCNAKAEKRKVVQRRPTPDEGWWQHVGLWAEREGFDAGCDRPIEDEVFEGLWLKTQRYAPDLSVFAMAEAEFGAEFVAELLKEALRELRNEMDGGGTSEQAPLKTIHQRQAAREEKIKPPKRARRPTRIGNLDFSGTGVG